MAAAGCGSSPSTAHRVPLTPGQPVEVVYADGSNRFTLRSATSVDEASYRERGLYGQVGADVKLTDQDTMQALVDALDELGHFATSQPQARPGARASLAVWLGDRQTVWSQPALLPENMTELERFNTARAVFLQVHNNIISYHSGSMSASDIEQAMREQNAKNRAAVQNLMQKERGRRQ